MKYVRVFIFAIFYFCVIHFCELLFCIFFDQLCFYNPWFIKCTVWHNSLVVYLLFWRLPSSVHCQLRRPVRVMYYTSCHLVTPTTVTTCHKLMSPTCCSQLISLLYCTASTCLANPIQNINSLYLLLGYVCMSVCLYVCTCPCGCLYVCVRVCICVCYFAHVMFF